MATSRNQRLLFTAVTLLYWMGMYAYIPTLSPDLSMQGLSLQMIGIVLGSYGLVQMLIRFPLGIASDKLGKRKPFILLGMICAAASCLLFLIPNSWLWPLAGRVVAGVCASTWVAFTVMYAGFFGAGQTGRAMGNISVMTVSGQMLGMLASGWLTDQFSPAAPFIAGAAAAIAGLLLALLLKEPEAPERREGGMSFRQVAEVVRSPMLLRVSLLSILAHGVLFITMFGFSPLKADELGAGGLELTILVFAFMLPHAVASFAAAAWFVPRFGYWGTISVGFIVSGLCTALMMVAPSLGWLYATQAVNGFAQGLHMPLLLGLAIRDVDQSRRATAMGLYQALYAVGMFSGPFVAGWLNNQYGIDSGFLFGAILAAAALLLVWRWSGRERRAAAKAKAQANERIGADA